MTGTERRNGIVFGVICGSLAIVFIWFAVSSLLAGHLGGALMAVVPVVFMLVGAVGGLLGAEALPRRSLADLVTVPMRDLLRRAPKQRA